jgi:hypothetical protein
MILQIILIGVLGIIGGLLGAFGGAGGMGGYSKSLRRIGIASLITIVALIVSRFHSWWYLGLMSLAGILSIGYGIPDFSDKGSVLGRFWYKIFKNSHFWANIFTRLTLAIALCVPALLIAWTTGSWEAYNRAVGAITANYMLWATIIPREGSITLFGRKLLVEEFLIYLGLTIGYLTLIFIG